MIKVKQAIIVEGKYDKIRLSNIVDAVIIETHGFGIYKDKETAELIRALAKKTGIIILTDSDSAGFRIRSHIRGIVKDGEIKNVYIPDIPGKEKRKSVQSKQGLLGVEGIDDETLLKAFEKAGVLAEKSENTQKEHITKSMLLDYGLTGGVNSALLREKFQQKLGLPRQLSTNLLIEILNTMYSKTQFEQIVKDFLDNIPSA